MVLLKEKESFNVSEFLQKLKEFDLQIEDVEISGTIILFKIAGDTFSICYLDFPIPEGDIKYAANLTDNWPNAWEELKFHRAHVLVTGFPGDLNQTDRFKALTKLILTLLHTSPCMGVYMGNQGLIIPTFSYMKAETVLREERLPITHWINVCMFKHRSKNYIRTVGLASFGVMEIDMIDSNKFEDLYPFICGVILEILKNQIKIKEGTFFINGSERITFEIAVSPLDDTKILRIV